MSTNRRLDIGIASYRNPERLRATLESIEAMSHTDWRCFIVHNPSNDEQNTEALIVADKARRANERFRLIALNDNVGYAGAVNKLFELAETPYVAYLDNDVEIRTPGWDEQLCALLDADPKIGQAFPGAGHHGFHNGRYHECLWNAGYAWIARRSVRSMSDPHAPESLRVMDSSLGHHEEVDLMIRLRLAGYVIACDPGVDVIHHETATRSPESEKRIHAGVVHWMNKWNRYFCGEALTYPNPNPDAGEGYDPRSLRYTDWPPCALYLERWTLAQFPDWNKAPRRVETTVGPMDAVEILKPAGYYAGRAI